MTRAYVGALVGDGWTTRYTYDRYCSTMASGGIAMGAVLGIDSVVRLDKDDAPFSSAHQRCTEGFSCAG